MKKYKIEFKAIDFKEIIIEAENDDEAMNAFDKLCLYELEECKVISNYDVNFIDIKEIEEEK